jgi:hypothetical protein
MPKTYARLSDRHPFEVYLLVLALMSSVPASLGLTPAPATIRVQLDPNMARLWAISLTVGAATALVGLSWKRPKFGLSVTGLTLEQVGLTFVGAATIFYSACAFKAAGLPAIIPIGTVAAFGAASFRQAWKIHRLLIALQEEAAA